MATGWPMKVSYANGDVYSASDVNDTNGTINLLGQSVTTSAGKNAIINGGFDVWQRGTSFSLAASSNIVYTADRWAMASGVNQATTLARQATGDTTNLPNIQYCMRFQRNSGQTGTGILSMYQSIETTNSIRFAGQSVTISFYARRGANYSSASNALSTYLYSGTGTDQNIYGGYTGSATAASGTATLTTTWQRFTYTGTVSASATELAMGFQYTPVGTASTNDYFEVTGVQLEIGTATTFARTGGTIQGELAACQRYYFRTSADASNNYAGYCMGYTLNSTTAYGWLNLPVQMRTPPSALDYASIAFENSGSTQYTASNCQLLGQRLSSQCIGINLTISGATGGSVGHLRSAVSTTGYLGFSAEL
jgi:hypothetical protein